MRQSCDIFLSREIPFHNIQYICISHYILLILHPTIDGRTWQTVTRTTVLMGLWKKNLCLNRSNFQTTISFIYFDMVFSKNRGTPKSFISNRVFHYTPSILGYLYFWKHLYILPHPRICPPTLFHNSHVLNLCFCSPKWAIRKLVQPSLPELPEVPEFVWFWKAMNKFVHMVKLPWKINMEPSNHPLRKEHDLNQTSMIMFQPLIFRGVMFNINTQNMPCFVFGGKWWLVCCWLVCWLVGWLLEWFTADIENMFFVREFALVDYDKTVNQYTPSPCHDLNIPFEFIQDLHTRLEHFEWHPLFLRDILFFCTRDVSQNNPH